MSLRATIALNLTGVETLADTYASDADKTVTVNGMNATYSLTGATTVPVTKQAAFQVAMTAGAATINLAALSGVNGAVIDLTGLKVQAIKLRSKSTNAATITIVPGASNGINIFGASSSITLYPGQEVAFYFKDQGQDVASGDRTIDISGTGTEILEVHIIAG